MTTRQWLGTRFRWFFAVRDGVLAPTTPGLSAESWEQVRNEMFEKTKRISDFVAMFTRWIVALALGEFLKSQQTDAHGIVWLGLLLGSLVAFACAGAIEVGIAAVVH